VQAYAEGEDYNYALMAYNGGEGDLRRMIRDGYTSSAYSRKVIGRMAKYGN
jgi:hypothetical protein